MGAMSQPTSDQDLTQLLVRAAAGDGGARDLAMQVVHPRLRALAGAQVRRGGGSGTLHATALVNEAYLRLFARPSDGWGSRGQFYAVAASAMRHIAVDHARRKAALKRGGGQTLLALDGVASEDSLDAEALIDLDDALVRLAQVSERQARLVEIRFFAGLSVEDAAKALDISERTAQLDWRAARAWLRAELESPAHD